MWTRIHQLPGQAPSFPLLHHLLTFDIIYFSPRLILFSPFIALPSLFVYCIRIHKRPVPQTGITSSRNSFTEAPACGASSCALPSPWLRQYTDTTPLIPIVTIKNPGITRESLYTASLQQPVLRTIRCQIPSAPTTILLRQLSSKHNETPYAVQPRTETIAEQNLALQLGLLELQLGEPISPPKCQATRYAGTVLGK